MNITSSDKDLPLMANVCDILVNHYIFDLKCSFEKHSFSGYVIMALSPSARSCCLCSAELSLGNRDNNGILSEQGKNVQNAMKQQDFLFVLDCADIFVMSVEEIIVSDEKFSEHKFNSAKLEFSQTEKLNFTVDKWSLKISKPGILCSCKFSRIVKITYETKPEGESILWVKDQDDRPAVYTYGAWINNRSLFPCQEPPTAMATWEAYISVSEPAIVLMSGDQNPYVSSHEGVISYYYCTKMKLPLSTLALAVGFWDIVDKFEVINDVSVPIRICAASSILPKTVKEISSYSVLCLRAAESILGPYPFSRIDFLIVPRGFNSLGMASPNIIFLSQSVLSENQTMCCRIAHEISHAWFGLLIGALDWTEEWLSEGFATFMEDLVHTKALRMSVTEVHQYCEIKAHFRLKVLMAEIENTDEELQVLRPNKGETVQHTVDGVDAVILINGRNTEKAFMQVHYIKGYFLLKYLSDLVELPAFIKFLILYISKYKGQLVESTEMLAFFIETFPEKCEGTVTVEKIVAEWLHTAGIPKNVDVNLFFAKNVFVCAWSEAKKWKLLNKKCLKRSTKKRKLDIDNFLTLSSEKLLILLDTLLEEEKIAYWVLKHLEERYDLQNQDAEIRHKWCELVVKHRYQPGYTCLKNFLMNDLAMGIYLFGELILNGTPSQKLLAEECFKTVYDEMEPNCVSTIQQMLITASNSS